MAESETDTQFCNNCKKQIASKNFVMHEMHCKRHISLCEHCKEPIPKNEMEVHFEEVHATMKCPKCDVEVEKGHFEDHEENSCAKKPMQCIYCELEQPKDGLESHLDYCGSRTEPCPKCSQFIMLKDLTRHTESGCSYPEVKPKGINMDNGFTGRGINVFDSVYDQLGMNNRGRGFGREDDEMFGVDIGPRRQANFRHAYKTTNQKADADRQKASIENESEYDRLLAMQLAQDLHRSDSLEDIVQTLDIPPRSPTFGGAYNGYRQNSLNADAAMIPCEFCGNPFDLEDLIQHQSGCSLERISNMLPQLTKSNNARDIGSSSPTQVQPPTVLNNLRNYGADEWLQDEALIGYDIPTDMERLPVTPPPETGNGDDTLFLPCEFCDELFPMDSLVQHQAMCDRMTMTPGPPTPPEDRRLKLKKKTAISSAQRLTADFPNLTSKRHQPPPFMSGTGTDSDDDSSPAGKSRSKPSSHLVQKPKPSIQNGALKSSVNTPAKETRSTLKKYGVETTDRSDYYTRHGSVSRQSSEDSTTDSWLNSSKTPVRQKLPGSAARTRSTLDNLLNDTDETSSHDLLAHIGAVPSRRKEPNPVPRQKATVTASQLKGPAKVKSRASARDVQQELSRFAASGSPAAAAALSNKNRSSKPGFEVRVRPAEADEPSDMLTASRSRPRANNVFGASSSKTNTKR